VVHNSDPASLKPVFVALRTAHYRAFEAGTKTVEYRRYGKRFNERVFLPGRAVVLGHGYTGAGRLRAIVERFEQCVMDTETYGPQQTIAVIHLRLDVASPQTGNPAATPPNPPG
jgi:hypothetical protein